MKTKKDALRDKTRLNLFLSILTLVIHVLSTLIGVRRHQSHSSWFREQLQFVGIQWVKKTFFLCFFLSSWWR